MNRLLLGALVLLLSAPVAQGGPPDEGRCPTVGGAPGRGPATDAIPIRLRQGMVVDHDTLLLLRQLLPEEVWQNRHAFFHPGMAMTIGACHRRYATPSFYREATALYAGQPTVDEQGNLEGFAAGQPFPPESFMTSPTK